MWKPVVGYKNIYEVNEDGQIRTVEGKTTFTEHHGNRKWKQRILKQKIGKDQCCRVSLWKDGECKTWLVHRIVAMAFLHKIENKDYVNHIDGNRLNNHISNLEWCNHIENNNHAFDNNLIKTGQVTSIYNKLTEETLYFRSMSKASEFLGKWHGFISNFLKQGKEEYKQYIIKEVDKT